MATYRLRKSSRILIQAYRAYKKRRHRLDPSISKQIKQTILELQAAILGSDREKADHYAKLLQSLAKDHIKKSSFEKFLETSFAIAVALCVAIVIRQTTFEPYEIPSGSMRPTYKEQDRLIVSKTQFGLNIPLTTKHLFFKPEQVKRMGVVVFTGEGMDIHNVKTRYFYLFPGYRQYIKRMIGLPGDYLYFYGGKIYGVNKEGRDVSSLLQLDELSHLEHIPFMQIQGKAIAPKAPINDIYSPVVFQQMNMPIVKLHLSSKKDFETEFLLKPETTNRSELEQFDIYKLWGMENFANARILPRSILAKKTSFEAPLSVTDYYLELTHHPSAAHPSVNRDAYFRTRPSITVEKSYIPLSEADLQKIWDHIYTGRIVVENGYLKRYGLSSKEANTSFLPKLKGIPDGTYEFTAGKLYEVKMQGITKLCPPDHPLAEYSATNLFTLFNAGIECDIRFLPVYHDQNILPSRYAYFRNGHLYLMGAKIFDKESETLKKYVEGEEFKKERIANYIPFIDHGPPLKQDGSLNVDLIKTYGLHVPDHYYFVLGDNHAMSGDSRDFGFVPESNIRGIPAFLFWAPGGRFGDPNHGIYSLAIPTIIIWGSLILIGLFYDIVSFRLFHRRFSLRFEQD